MDEHFFLFSKMEVDGSGLPNHENQTFLYQHVISVDVQKASPVSFVHGDANDVKPVPVAKQQHARREGVGQQ